MSQDFSEGERLVFKTPEMSTKTQDKEKITKTAKAEKHNKLDVKSGTKSRRGVNGKTINLSDILKTTEYDGSEYVNLLDDENISGELVSLTNYDQEAYKPIYAQYDRSQTSVKTPNFGNRVQSKIKQMGNEDSGSKNSMIHDGRFLNMSLGDIPEELEETYTHSDNCPSQ